MLDIASKARNILASFVGAILLVGVAALPASASYTVVTPDGLCTMGTALSSGLQTQTCMKIPEPWTSSTLARGLVRTYIKPTAKSVSSATMVVKGYAVSSTGSLTLRCSNSLGITHEINTHHTSVSQKCDGFAIGTNRNFRIYSWLYVNNVLVASEVRPLSI